MSNTGACFIPLLSSLAPTSLSVKVLWIAWGYSGIIIRRVSPSFHIPYYWASRFPRASVTLRLLKFNTTWLSSKSSFKPYFCYFFFQILCVCKPANSIWTPLSWNSLPNTAREDQHMFTFWIFPAISLRCTGSVGTWSAFYVNKGDSFCQMFLYSRAGISSMLGLFPHCLPQNCETDVRDFCFFFFTGGIKVLTFAPLRVMLAAATTAQIS